MLPSFRTRALWLNKLRELQARLWPRMVGTLKASAYLVLVSLCGLFFSIRSARGALGEVSLTIARQLNDVSDLIGSTKFLELNGQRFGISTTVVAGSAADVLDRFADACRKNSAELTRVAASQGLTLRQRASQGAGSKPIARVEAEEDGIVGCVLRSDAGPVAPLSETIREFARTRDASVFGDFLVVYARNQAKDKKNPKDKTHVVAVWTHGPFKVLDLFPAQGDAPGSDSVLAGRPREARRILSGAAANEPYGLRIYETTKTPGETLSSFERDMRSRGWTRLAQPPNGVTAVALQHTSGVLAVLTANPSDGTKSALVLMEMGRGKPN